MTSTAQTPRRFGWRPDTPDQRDHRFDHAKVLRRRRQKLPAKVDLRSLALHAPVFDQGDLGSCHDDETEVLAESGWKFFSDVTGADRLATVDPATGALTYERPTRLVRFEYSGPLICARGRSVNFRVTPDHKMLVRKWDEAARTLSDDYHLVAAKDLGWYSGLLNRVWWGGSAPSDTFCLPGVDHKHRPQREDQPIPMAVWMRFLGIYLAEGTILKESERGPSRASYKIQIAAAKPREKDFVRDLLAKMGLTALELADRFTVSNKRLYRALEGLGLAGVKAAQKFVPSLVFEQSAEIIREFLLGHFMGDGSEQNGLRVHYTSSVQLANDLQRLVFLSGDETYLSVRAVRAASMAVGGRVIQGRYPEHRVSVRARKNLSLERKQLFTEQYDGEVFCAEVPTHHTLVTRRGGCVLISGNCTANAIGKAFEFAQRKQGLQDYAPSRLFIYYGERELEGSINYDAGAEIRDGLKVVNKLGAPHETLWPYSISRFTVRPSAPVYADGAQHQALGYASVDVKTTAVKAALAAGFPVVVGFTVYTSFYAIGADGFMPLPKPNEGVEGGHAVLVMGYARMKAKWDRAAKDYAIVLNSWSDQWGDQGFFYIPLGWLCDRTNADDFWTLTEAEA